MLVRELNTERRRRIVQPRQLFHVDVSQMAQFPTSYLWLFTEREREERELLLRPPTTNNAEFLIATDDG